MQSKYTDTTFQNVRVNTYITYNTLIYSALHQYDPNSDKCVWLVKVIMHSEVIFFINIDFLCDTFVSDIL